MSSSGNSIDVLMGTWVSIVVGVAVIPTVVDITNTAKSQISNTTKVVKTIPQKLSGVPDILGGPLGLVLLLTFLVCGLIVLWYFVLRRKRNEKVY